MQLATIEQVLMQVLVTDFDRVKASEVNQVREQLVYCNITDNSTSSDDSCVENITCQKNMHLFGNSHMLIKRINMYVFCFLWLKYLPILLAEFLFLLATYFAQNSAGKIIKAYK